MSIADSLTAAGARASASEWLAALGAAMAARDSAAAADLFLPEAFLRDILALTWDLRTFSGRGAIEHAIAACLDSRNPFSFELSPQNVEVFERRGWGMTIEAFFTFETDVAYCRGFLRLRPVSHGGSAWKAWTVLTAMEDLRGFEERARANRPRELPTHPGLVEPGVPDRVGNPEVLIVGAGQAGLAIAARLRQLDVDATVVEREARVGDIWRNRYQSLVLHNQVWANHLPYMSFPDSWPQYLSKEHVADWLELYASALSLRVATSTEVVHSDYDGSERVWTVTLRHADGTSSTVRPRHVVLASGVFGVPRRLNLPGQDTFDGTVLHATEYAGEEDVRGLTALVVGSGSSAHDVAQNLVEHGADVTMLQRSSTCVVSVEPGAARAYAIYREGGPPVEDADLVTNSFPFPLLTEMHKELTLRIAELDAELLQGLNEAGFRTDFGDDGSGFLMKYHRTGGGYYINVGASDLIVGGHIKVKHGVEVDQLRGGDVVFSDGSTMPVDLVVVAVGYGNMSEKVRELFGDEVADAVGPVWGLDDEGEVRAMWRRTGQPGFWLMGGSLQQCRPYSKYLAMEIKGALEGLDRGSEATWKSNQHAS